MFEVSKDLGVQSWCFRSTKTVEGLLEQIKQVGLQRVELCGVHANFDDEKGFDALLAKFKQAGVQITSLGVQGFGANEAREEKWFDLAKRAGATMIAATFDLEMAPACYRVVEKLGDKYDINVGIHNHGGYDWLGNARMLDFVFKYSGPRIGLCLDTAWAMQARFNPVEWVGKYADRLYGIHLKDFVFDRGGQWEDVVVGTGNLRLKEVLAAVASKAPKCKVVTLEYEGDEANPGPKVIECVAAVRAAG